MTKLFPLALFICIASITFGQTPVPLEVGKPSDNRSMACPPGVTPDAGTSTQTLFPSAQSNNTLFLCLGDSMAIDHFGGDLSGDPDASSAPGFSYVFYNCPPTVTGPTAADILTDLCHVEIVTGMVTAVQSGVNINGDATFFNNGQIQTTFNSGDPATVWFAPVTLDDFATFGFEDDGTGTAGPCINVNTNDAFSVTYLNAIDGININTASSGSCTGSFNVIGGLPELDGSTYSNITITLNTDPSVEADITGANFTHNDLIEFVVPQAGVYNVLIEDDVSCAASFTIDMTGCLEVTFDASEEFGSPGDVVCVQVDVSDFDSVLSFQYTINWDPTVLQYQSVNDLGALNDLNFGPAAPTDALTANWFDPTFVGTGLPDGTGIFEICFTIIGVAGTSSPITFDGSLTQVEVLSPTFFPYGFNGQSGLVTVAGDLTVTTTSCSSPSTGNNSGTFSITVSGGAPPYSYTWDATGGGGLSGSGNILGFGGTATIGDNDPPGDNPLPPGTYDITVTDANGTMQSVQVTIANAPQLLVFINGTPPTCADGMDGTMEITSLPLGGVAPYDIVWSNMETDVTTITNLPQGVYSVTVTDANGCSQFAQNGLQTAPIVVDTVTLNHVTCNGPGNDGAITVSASGGTIAPGNDYDYDWDNGMVGPNITGLTPGQYCVSVTDDNMCVEVHCITINAPMPPMIVNWDSISVSCPSDMNGSLTVNAIAGNAVIDSYTWDPAQPGADETISNLGPGTYYVSITAVDGCVTVDSATLFAPTPLVFDSSQVQIPNCPGDNNGSVTAFVSGGTAPYTYNWSTGTTSNFSLLPGLVGDSTYTVTITDSGVCGDTVIMDIFLPNPPSIQVQFIDLVAVTCDNGVPCDGQATAIASGGTAGTGLYNFNWPSGESFMDVAQSSAMQLCQGTLTLEVNDGLCSTTVDTVIGAPDPLTVDIDNTFSVPTSCFNDTDGGATVQGDGGTPGYTYQWADPPVNGPTIMDVAAGNYDVVITDANGCTFDFTIEVGEPDSLIATISSQMDATCAGSEDGFLEVTWTGGNPGGNTTYSWTSNVSTSSTANNLPVGTYSVTVTDENGCNDIATGQVAEPPAIVFELDSIADPLCFGFQTFITIDTAFGGEGGFNPPYQFAVNNGPAQPIFGAIPVLAGTQLVTVFDASGCTSEQEIIINQPPPVTVDLGPDVEIELGDSLALVPIIGSALPIDSILWAPDVALTCLDIDCSEVSVMPLEAQLYSINVVDVNGCSGSDEILVDVDKNRNVYIPNIFTPDGDGFNDIFTVFTGTGVEVIRSMRVFDRWGEQVFEAMDIIPAGDFSTIGWDGRFNGKIMNPGVFVYLIEVEFTDGVLLLYRGDVTIMH